VLTAPNAAALAEKAIELLGDPVRRLEMSREGIKLMGGSGALAAVIEYAANELGWDARCRLFGELQKTKPGGRMPDEGEPITREGKREWKMPDRLASKVMKLMKIIK
jgi:hypothetical protein